MESDFYWRCPICGGKLHWESDANAYEVCSLHEEGDDTIAQFFTCSTCGRSLEIVDPPKELRESDYKDYWDGDVQ